MAPALSTNPWPNERIVVVSDDPASVEAAVTQLEAWGAFPAVMFERSRAIRALSVAEPDLVVLDFGRDPAAARSLLGSLEQVQPILPGTLHPAPVVALAESPVAPRLERDAWAPIHVAPHDDAERVRAALLAALEDASAAGGSAATGAATGAAPGAAPAAAVAPGRAAPLPAARGARRSLVPLATATAAALALAAIAIAISLRSSGEAGAGPGASQPAGAPGGQFTGAAALVTRGAPAPASALGAATVPATSAVVATTTASPSPAPATATLVTSTPAAPTAASVIVQPAPTAAPTVAVQADTSVAAATDASAPPARLPGTGSR